MPAQWPTSPDPDGVAPVDQPAGRLPRSNPHRVRALLDGAPARWIPFPSVDAWPTSSAAGPESRFTGPVLLDPGRRLGDDDLTAPGTSTTSSRRWRIGNSSITQGLRCLVAGLAAPVGALPQLTASSDYFRGVQCLPARTEPADPATPSVAVKGGHNGELHNQNDIGSLIVRRGGEDLVVDPGSGHHTRAYFDAHRYEHFATRTFGRSVPLPAGREQEEGVGHQATVLDLIRSPERDRTALDLTGAYPARSGRGLLHRTVERARARVVLTDATSFHTHAEVDLEPGRLLLRGSRAALAITFDHHLVVGVHTEPVPLFGGLRNTTRTAFRSRGEVPAAAVELVTRPR